MKLTILVGVLALTFVAGGTLMWRAADASSPPVLLALGDSVTAGVGDSEADGGYAARVSAALQPGRSERAAGIETQHVRFVSHAAGGATTASMLAPDGQLARAVAEIRARRASPSPHDDVDTVVLSIGGNDLYGPLIGACAAAPTPQDPASPCGAAIAGLPALFGAIGQNLGSILGTLRTEAGNEASIVVLTYYNPLQACALAHLAPLAAAVLEGPDAQVATGDGFNDVIRGAVRHVPGAYVAETYAAIGAAHLVGGSDCLHPNPAGHARIADIVLEALGPSRP